jgi:hypothetical protein
MTRTILPMDVADLSAFAKSLRQQLLVFNHKPSHVEMLNLLCRAAGFANYQHFRAVGEQRASLVPAPVSAVTTSGMTDPSDRVSLLTSISEPQVPPDEARVMKTLRVFDGEGRLVRWPGKRSQQELCLWFLWSKIPRGASYSERAISTLLNGMHSFADPARLRRDMFDLGLVRRNRDGSDYRRIERKPPPELRLLSALIGQKRQAA